MTLKERNPASSTLLYQRAMDRRAASFDCVFGKDHPQGMAQSVCRFDVRVFFKQYRSPLLLPVGPFVGRLEQEITRAYKQFPCGCLHWDSGTGYTPYRFVWLPPSHH